MLENKEKVSINMELQKNGCTKEIEVSFEDAFEMTGHGKFNHLVLLACGLILLNVTMESVGIGYVVTAAECDLHLTSQHKGLISATTFIDKHVVPYKDDESVISKLNSLGIISTSFLWGYLGDRIGRRAIMLPAILVSSVLSVASSFSVNVWMLLFLRIITGFFISASSATVYAYLGEMHTSSRRASAIAWGSAFISFAFILTPGLAWFIIPGTWSLNIFSLEIHPWQALMWFWCLPGLLAAAILSVLPESPRFLLARNSPDDALKVLAVMYSWNHCGRKEDFPVKKISSLEQAKTEGGFSKALKDIGIMFRPPLLRCVIISYSSIFAVFLLSSGLYLWVPDILNSILKHSTQNSTSICEIIHKKFELKGNHTDLATIVCQTDVSVGVFPISMGMGSIFAITYFAIGVFINKIGRTTMYCTIMIVCGLATAGSAFVPPGSAATTLLIIALCSGCASSIVSAIAVDVFPTSMRAMAMCILFMVGRGGAVIGSNILGATLDNHCQLAFSGFGAFVIGTTLLLLFWPNPEKVRKEMEQKGLSY